MEAPDRSNGKRRGPYINVLKHGLRSGTVLLSGCEVGEFRKLRHRLFHLHRPRTIEEALCVETVAASHWRIARCRLEQTHFKRQLGAVISGDPDATGYLSTPDAHGIHHRGADCFQEEARLERFKAKALAQLRVLQKQRMQDFSREQLRALEDYTVFMAEGEPMDEFEEAAPPVQSSEAPTDAPGKNASGYSDKRSGLFAKKRPGLATGRTREPRNHRKHRVSAPTPTPDSVAAPEDTPQ